MNQLLCQHVENLKSALLSLPATGETGFEGLIGATLCEISRVPFRLAGSGSQFGVDGKPAYERDAICFECKRYDGPVPKNGVLSKIAEVPLSDPEIDIWVLCATSPIRVQIAKLVRKRGNKDGIFVLILDWSETDLPPLAVALAMGETRVQDFLKNNISDDETLRKAMAALEAVRNSQDFASHSDRIRAQCNEPAVGLALAQRANTNWLCEAFSSRQAATLRFGQPLAPGAETAKTRTRKTLIDQLNPYLTAAPDETVVFVLGGEGFGKSWIVAQSWLDLARKPLMLFLPLYNFANPAWEANASDLLIKILIDQTGERHDTTTIQKRWRRRLGQWRNCPAADGPRLIVVIDGINQRPGLDWARNIMRIADEVYQLGGRVVVTVRTPDFRYGVEPRLTVPSVEISVPEWTESERDEMLAAAGMKASDLHPRVAVSLRNPRLLGIVLELMTKDEISRLEELSGIRLLFEHMRMSEQDAPEQQLATEFARRLRNHAQAIISRIKAGQEDDLAVFEADIEAVADGRFFQGVDGAPTRYSLKDEGLTLALGLFVIDQINSAQRNGRNPGDELNVILEPMASLDDTADVVLAALTVSALDERFGQDTTTTALIEGFALLQNPDTTKFPNFSGLARRQPQCFMDAAQALCLSGGYQPNFDWIQDALIVAGRNSCTWQKMVDKVHFWLSVHSLSPDRGTFFHTTRDPHEKVQEEREKNRKKIEEKLQALSANEIAILENLPEEEGDLSRLSRLALFLLAGKSLAPFAKSLLNWSFSNALNSDHAAPYKEFMHLVSLNRIDWSQTRVALLEVSAPLREADVSTTGKWTLVNILRATGHSEDGKEARSLVEELTKDWPPFEGWRLIEKYCATDPCDPTSEQPQNITRTAEQYAAIDVSKLRQSMGQASEDHFFNMARPGIARFKPEVAVAKHRGFAADVLNRAGFPLRQGLLELRQHNALLTIKEARELVKKRDEAKIAGTAGGLSEHDTWIVSQYHLLLAFPFLSAQEQAEILLSNEADESILCSLMDLAKPLGEKEFEILLGTICGENNERKQYLMLGLAKHASVHLSKDARTHIAALFRSESERVRAQALRFIAQSGDEELLCQVAESDWKATDTKTENCFEVWYGSLALLEAAARGLIAHDEALDRISARLYGRAATMLDAGAVCEIARRIDASINQAASLNGDLVAPDIEIQVYPSDLYEPSMFSVSERPSGTKDIKEAMKRLSESSEAFEQRQRRNYDAFLGFKANLTQAKASIVLDYLSLEEFATVIATAEEFADRWHGLFMSIAEAKLPAIHNLVLLLAHALGRKAPSKAEELFRRVKESKPLVRFTFGRAGVQFDAMATWAGIRNPVMNDLRFERLDRVCTDHDLSLEVLAALFSEQQDLLTEYIETKLRKIEPAEIARGIIVAGFSDQSEFNDETLKRYEGSAGLIGSAQKAAKYAYERNVWARHWFEKMCQTNENTDFWRYAVLFSKIVDGRFAVWRSQYPKKSKPIQSFGPGVDGWLKNRFARWENHRNKKLFGSDATASIFLEGADVNE